MKSKPRWVATPFQTHSSPKIGLLGVLVNSEDDVEWIWTHKRWQVLCQWIQYPERCQKTVLFKRLNDLDEKCIIGC